MTKPTRLAAQACVATLKQLLVRLEPGDRSWLARHMVSDRWTPQTRALMDFSYGTIRGWKNGEFDIATNGEATLLARLRQFDMKTIVDVGANVGEWSLAALRQMPDATIHAFEIAPATAAKLRQNAAVAADHIIINACGLGETTGEITLYYTPESDTASSTIREAIEVATPHHRLTGFEEIKVPITSGDAYMAEHGLTRIDLLKIDVEGAEMKVLNGFRLAFANSAIELVQFEYSLVNLRTRVFLEDFYRFFSDNGFLLGKLLPEGVAFKPYDIVDEDFIGLNFVACRMDRPDIIAAIGCQPLSL